MFHVQELFRQLEADLMRWDGHFYPAQAKRWKCVTDVSEKYLQINSQLYKAG